MSVRFKDKIGKINKAIEGQNGFIAVAVDHIHDRIRQEVDKNVSGPAYGVRKTKTGGQVPNRGPQTGKMPIPRITGTLARSVISKRPAPEMAVIYVDDNIAKSGKYVHNGTRLQKARRFLSDPVNILHNSLIANAKEIIITGIRPIGQS